MTPASGNLGLISFPRIPHRVRLEDLEERYPQVVPTLRDHTGVAFMLVHYAEHGPVVIGRKGKHYPADHLLLGPGTVHDWMRLARRGWATMRTTTRGPPRRSEAGARGYARSARATIWRTTADFASA